MTKNLHIIVGRKKFIVCLFLSIAVLAVFGQVQQFDFLKFDDEIYVTENPLVQSGITPAGVQWAFSTMYAEFWHPMTWLSLMFDYQIYGLTPADTT